MGSQYGAVWTHVVGARIAYLAPCFPPPVPGGNFFTVYCRFYLDNNYERATLKRRMTMKAKCSNLLGVFLWSSQQNLLLDE